jgi:glycerol-3-phosphate dehydrogenase (NAD(P)+)
VAQAIRSTRRNPKYLASFALGDRITAYDSFAAMPFSSTDFIIMATPTQFMRDTLLKLAPYVTDRHRIILANKGIEISSLKLPLQILTDVLGEEAENRTTILSGPSFAVEIMEGHPTAVAVGAFKRETALDVQELMHSAQFRVYTADDPMGLEVAGALKNVIAIAAGACAGLGLQQNSRAALLTRGLAEMTRFGVAMGANPLTFNGLGGVGDLFLTCTSEKSRNFTVGYRLGKGESIKDIVRTVGSIAEGVATAKAAYALAKNMNIDSPITTQVYEVLYEEKPVPQALNDLLMREAKAEHLFS